MHVIKKSFVSTFRDKLHEKASSNIDFSDVDQCIGMVLQRHCVVQSHCTVLMLSNGIHYMYSNSCRDVEKPPRIVRLK